jgi:hypothetical protein
VELDPEKDDPYQGTAAYFAEASQAFEVMAAHKQEAFKDHPHCLGPENYFIEDPFE